MALLRNVHCSVRCWALTLLYILTALLVTESVIRTLMVDFKGHKPDVNINPHLKRSGIKLGQVFKLIFRDLTAHFKHFQWVYNDKGEYKMNVHAFNFLSATRYELPFTVSSIPCRPPELMIRDNSTEFWKPKVSPV